MKTPLLSLSAALCLATAAQAATVLLNETWSGYTNGAIGSQFATNGGIWSLESGASSGLTVQNNASSGSGKGLNVTPASGSWVRVNTANGYSAANGARFDLEMMRLTDLQAFTRMRIQTTYSLTNTTGYYLTISGTGLALTHLTGSGSTEIGSYTFASGAFEAGTTYELGLQVATGAGGNTVSVYFNDTRVINVIDSAVDRPNFISNSFYFGFDSRRVSDSANAKALYGDITVTAVPEAPSTALALFGLGGAVAWRWAARRRAAGVAV